MSQVPNFTELFAQTLNATIAKLVEEAVKPYAARIEELEEQVRELAENSDTDVEGIVERTIENYDFAEIVANNVDLSDILEDREFADAVRSVIRDAL